jgi:hypothetical protein
MSTLASKPFSCRFDAATHTRLRRASAAQGLPISELIRRAVSHAAGHGLGVVCPRGQALRPAPTQAGNLKQGMLCG